MFEHATKIQRMDQKRFRQNRGGSSSAGVCKGRTKRGACGGVSQKKFPRELPKLAGRLNPDELKKTPTCGTKTGNKEDVLTYLEQVRAGVRKKKKGTTQQREGRNKGGSKKIGATTSWADQGPFDGCVARKGRGEKLEMSQD